MCLSSRLNSDMLLMATRGDNHMAPTARHHHKRSPAADEAKVIITGHDGVSFRSPIKDLHLFEFARGTSPLKFYMSGFFVATEDGTLCNAYLSGKVVLMVGGGASNSMPRANRNEDTIFVLDSGAAVHVTGNYALFSSLTAVAPGSCVRAANGHTLAVVGSGVVLMDGFRLKDVLFVPGLTRNLVSVSKLAEQDYNIQFRGAECFVWDTRPGGALVGKGRLVAGIYELERLEIPLDREAAPAEQTVAPPRD